ncbi:uncharacterized protein ColSpa_00021 [Colletotrichum spaethianum]|uniref:Nucleoside phosphorylase domain-containing protein n=1 Tax=Colletotrichum spaethianum TaxID=700344 RepID=A0AA37L417_9PEZI|nr:uncharacterized protein ColSpa_00021 [Colletotrichum spaethianum]GKT39840.1 hypothetical protein ColSpa_00021 [Colletotrichum spaethianum]
MACLPEGQYGITNAAIVASNMKRSFGSIQFGFMVGIGGGAPGDIDIRLGDVVVGTHVFQHDFGKIEAGDKFRSTGTKRLPPQILLNAISKLRAGHERSPSLIPWILDDMFKRCQGLKQKGYGYPVRSDDQLFYARYDHPTAKPDCSECSSSEVRCRKPRATKDPHIHYGGIASGNQVIKSGRMRDKLAKEHDVLCFEMEGIGLADAFPCMVVRGICDYSDSHKNKKWQSGTKVSGS